MYLISNSESIDFVFHLAQNFIKDVSKDGKKVIQYLLVFQREDETKVERYMNG